MVYEGTVNLASCFTFMQHSPLPSVPISAMLWHVTLYPPQASGHSLNNGGIFDSALWPSRPELRVGVKEMGQHQAILFKKNFREREHAAVGWELRRGGLVSRWNGLVLGCSDSSIG